MKHDIRVMNYFGHVIWYYEGAYMVAKGDGTDEYFDDIHAAMDWIDKRWRNKK